MPRSVLSRELSHDSSDIDSLPDLTDAHGNLVGNVAALATSLAESETVVDEDISSAHPDAGADAASIDDGKMATHVTDVMVTLADGRLTTMPSHTTLWSQPNDCGPVTAQ